MPDLSDFLFLYCIQVGAMAAGSSAIQKQTDEGKICDVATIFAGMGAVGPRLDYLHKMNFLLTLQMPVYAYVKPPLTYNHP